MTMLSLLAALGIPRMGQAQVVVSDPATELATSSSAVSNAVSLINQALDLASLGELALSEGFADDLATMGDIITDGTALLADIQQLQGQIGQLFGLNTAPDTLGGLEDRLTQIKALKYRVRCYVLETQTLTATAMRTITHLSKLMDDVGALAGNKSAQQVSIQQLSVMNATLLRMQTQASATQTSETVDKMSEALIVESLNRIQAKRWESWPRWGGR